MRYYLISSDPSAIIRLTLGVFFGALLLLAFYFISRWLSKSPVFMRRSSYMRVIDRVSLSKDSYLALIEMAGKIFAVCVTHDGARLIASFELSDILDRPIGGASGEMAGNDTGLSRFFSYLRHGGPPKKSDGKSPEAELFEDSAATFETYFRSAAEPMGKHPSSHAGERPPPRPQSTETDAVDSLLDRISERKVVYFKKSKRK